MTANELPPPQEPRRLRPVPEDPPFDPDYDAPPSGPRSPSAAVADLQAEQAVLTALLHQPDLGATLIDQLDTDDFFYPIHAQLWTTWHHLASVDGTPPDLVTLNAHLLRTKQTDAARQLADLTTNPATPVLASKYAQIVRDTARLRTVDQLASGLRQIATTGRVDDIDTYLAEALQRLDDTVMRFGPRTTNPTHTGLADLTWVLSGVAPTSPPPVYARRTDGTALFYRGRVNGVFGDPESGKTWLAQIAGVEALNNGGTFTMVDVDHNGQDHTAARLMLLGAHPTAIADPTRFRYYEPEDAEQLRAAVIDITSLIPDVVILDSLGEILPMLGVKSVDNDEITAALRTICMPPAKAGSCVIAVDHLPKSAEARSTGYAIGGTAKKRAVDGAYLRAEARTQPTPGGIGRITLRIEKDRTGELRKSSGGGYAGTFTLDSTVPGVTTWSIGREDSPITADGKFRPTHLMERISRHVEDNDQSSFREIKLAVRGTDTHLRAAIECLVAEGFLSRIDGRNNAKLHHSIATYREDEDDQA